MYKKQPPPLHSNVTGLYRNVNVDTQVENTQRKVCSFLQNVCMVQTYTNTSCTHTNQAPLAHGCLALVSQRVYSPIGVYDSEWRFDKAATQHVHGRAMYAERFRDSTLLGVLMGRSAVLSVCVSVCLCVCVFVCLCVCVCSW